MFAMGAQQEYLIVSSEQHGHMVRLNVAGELDMATSPILEGWVTAAERIGISEIVVDLGHVTFIDTSGLHLFLDAAKRGTRSGRRLTIVGALAPVRRIFELTDTTHLFGADPLIAADV
jgi:anti-sigma B factor antagonist